MEFFITDFLSPEESENWVLEYFHAGELKRARFEIQRRKRIGFTRPATKDKGQSEIEASQ